MSELSSGQVPAEQFDATQFVRVYEWALGKGVEGQAKAERLEEIILHGILDCPDFVPSLYSELISSTVIEVRQMAASGIAKAFNCDPGAVGPLWNQLLRDSDPAVGAAAYQSFNDYSDRITKGLEHDRDMSAVTGEAG